MISKINFTGLHGVYTAENKKNLAKLTKHRTDNFGGQEPIKAISEALDIINDKSLDTDVFLNTKRGISYVYDRHYVEMEILDEDGHVLSNTISVNGYPYPDGFNVMEKLTELPPMENVSSSEVPEQLAVVLNKFA